MHACLRSVLECILDNFYFSLTFWNFCISSLCLTDSYACYRLCLKVDYFALFDIKRDFWKSERIEIFIINL
ncbi:hypothetical protein HanIR_Chr13g0634331 [Helianthus annuus]|nr:hypothetical protein HanIR_Chr13g0634331 [Helianthus annuus]